MALKGLFIINNRSGGLPMTSSSSYRWRAQAGYGVPGGLRRKIIFPASSSEAPAIPLDWQAIVDYIGFPAFMKPMAADGRMFQR
jgi:hypothetical protein